MKNKWLKAKTGTALFANAVGAGAASVDRVADEGAFRFRQHVESNHPAKLLKIWFARVDAGEVVLNLVMIWRPVRERCGALLDILCDLRQRGSAVGTGEFQTVVRRWIVARRDVHAAVQLSVQDRVRDHRSRSGLAAQEHAATVGPQDRRGGQCKFRREETSVAADDQRRGFLSREHVARNRGRRAAHARESEVLGNNAAPA